ncbi:L-rhamnose mutarotase [Fulvivirgaceae bacterium BMA12]|uniref:L-rhamnose mutarotase n=1 Tax=Agaribacillus aureus TaxID=3051825 RepID=A0ABT8LB52_9BACT|nr:L-rhamnose mutarotase [Fulvivirgaceae bacterium BMA12]
MAINSIDKTMLMLVLVFSITGCRQQNEHKSSKASGEKISESDQVRRYGSVIKVKPEMLDRYKQLHANPWPGVLEQLSKSNIRNYSIYLKDNYLFSYFEYVGNDFESDMAKMAKDSITLEWWKQTDPCQEPLENRAEGEWWAMMEEVFHHD